MKKRHLTPKELIAQCNAIARENRMVDRTPWTATGIICAYTIMRSEGFKGQRILKLINKINELEDHWNENKLSIEDISKRLQEKAGWTVEHKIYTEADITAKKGTFDYWIDSKQIAPQNAINQQATRYMLFFYTALMDEYGFGKERLTRVAAYMDSILPQYQVNKSIVVEWKKALLDEAGVVLEMPLDPLTHTKGSLMTGIL